MGKKAEITLSRSEIERIVEIIVQKKYRKAKRLFLLNWLGELIS
jgi:hypothetical protein